MAVNPTQTRKTDLRDLADISKTNSLSGLRINAEYIDQALMALERQLQQSRTEEQLLVQSIRRDATLYELQEKYNSDHFKKINPVQAYAPADSGTPDPHEYNVYVSNKLINLEGINQLLREQERVRANVLYIQSQINKLKAEKEEINKKLSEKGIKKGDSEQDKISKKMVCEIFLLYQIHRAYKENAVNLKEEEAYTEDTKIVRLLETLQTKFVAFAERNPWVISGKIILDLENPGSDNNAKVLENLLKVLRTTSMNERAYKKVQKYAQEMRRNLNDPTVSKNVTGKTIRDDEPSSNESQAKKTKSLAGFLDLTETAVNWWTTHALAALADAAEKKFDRFINTLHGDKPFCDAPPKTEEEKKRDAAEIEKDEAEESGIEEQQKRLTRAEEEVTDPVQKQLNSLAGLSEILDIFLKSNPDAMSGIIKYQGIFYAIGIANGSYNYEEYQELLARLTNITNILLEYPGEPPPDIKTEYDEALKKLKIFEKYINSVSERALAEAIKVSGFLNWKFVESEKYSFEVYNGIATQIGYAIIEEI